MWNLRSPPRSRPSRTMPVTLPVSSSQRIPTQEVGQAVDSVVTVGGFHVSRTFPSGSTVMPFLNSSKDRSSCSEAAEAEVRSVRKKNMESESEGSGGFIGVNVTHINDSLIEREGRFGSVEP